MARKNNIGRRPTGTPASGRQKAAPTNAQIIEEDDTLVDVVEVQNQSVDFFERNRNTIIFGALGIAALIAAYFIYLTFIQAPAERDAAAHLQQAQVAFERDSFAIALEQPAPGALGFLDIIDEYGSTEAANLAQYYAAVSYLNLGEFEAAKEFAKRFDASGTLLPAMKSGIIGDAESELGNFDAAISYYREAVEEADDNFVTGGYYLNKLGLLLHNQGRNEEALEAFRQLKADYGRSPLAAEADKYIALLELEVG